jgi:hypothetical protein
MRRAKAEARQRGVSLAALIRDALERELAAAPDDPRDQVRELRGRYHSGYTDVAEEHDEHLAILEAACRGEAAEASGLMATHIATFKEVDLRALQRRRPSA